MGCLKSIRNFVVFIVVIIAFFALGGFSCLRSKYMEYTHPKRNVFVEEEKDFGGFENVNADYNFTRSLNLFGYRKINIKYLPEDFKITIVDLNSTEILTEKDFKNDTITRKLEEISNNSINSPYIPVSNIEIINKGNFSSGSKLIPYIDFSADFKYIPFLKIKGTMACYESQNNNQGLVADIKDKIQKNDSHLTSKLIISTKFSNNYQNTPVKNFIEQARL